MKTRRSLKLLLGAVALVVATSATQAKEARAPADVQASFDKFIADFRKALKANDAEAVTRMTGFPFHFADKPDAEFFRKTGYAKIFTPKVRGCIARAKGVYDRDDNGGHGFSVFCGETIYFFTKTPDGFRFTDIGAND